MNRRRYISFGFTVLVGFKQLLIWTASCKISLRHCRVKNQAYQLVRIAHKIPGHHNSPADTNWTVPTPHPTPHTPPTKDVTADMQRQKLLNLPKKVRAKTDRKYHHKSQTVVMIDKIASVSVHCHDNVTGCSTNLIQPLITVITIALSVQR
jgi:hypothetical protein